MQRPSLGPLWSSGAWRICRSYLDNRQPGKKKEQNWGTFFGLAHLDHGYKAENAASSFRKCRRLPCWSQQLIQEHNLQLKTECSWRISKPNFWLVLKSFHLTISPIKEYWRRVLQDVSWLQGDTIKAFNSTQRWIAQLEQKTGFRIVTKWTDKQKRPSSVHCPSFPTLYSYRTRHYLESLTKDMNLGHAHCPFWAPPIDLWLEIMISRKFIIQGCIRVTKS